MGKLKDIIRSLERFKERQIQELARKAAEEGDAKALKWTINTFDDYVNVEYLADVALEHDHFDIVTMLMKDYGVDFLDLQDMNKGKFSYEAVKYVVENTDDQCILSNLESYNTTRYIDLFFRMIERAKDKREALNYAVQGARNAFGNHNLPLMKVLYKRVPDLVISRIKEIRGSWRFWIRDGGWDAMNPEKSLVDEYLLEVVLKKELGKDPKIVSAITKVAGKDLGGLISRYL